MIRVGVLGALGRMGRAVCAAVQDDPETILAAAIDRAGVGTVLESGAGKATVKVSDEIDLLTAAEVDVVVDFTHPSTVMDNLRWCIRHAIDVVCGTTGIPPEGFDELRSLIAEEGGESNVFVAPNFAIGAVLMTRFAASASRYLPAVEIVELHHDGKADAPSGTALRTAYEISLVRPVPQPVNTEEVLPGARGASVHGIPVHSVRLPGLVAHQEVILGGPGQSLTIRHDSYDRTSFMPGVLLAVKRIRHHPGLTVGLEEILDELE